MNAIELRELNKDNFYDVCKLSDTLTESQKRCVAPNIYSIAQAHFYPENAWFRGIYLGEEPIGFIMLDMIADDDDIPMDDKPSAFLWRFMIAKDHQEKGYGRKVLDLITEKLRKEGKKTLYTSCHIEEAEPLRFYLNYGFTDTGVFDDGEEVLKMTL